MTASLPFSFTSLENAGTVKEYYNFLASLTEVADRGVLRQEICFVAAEVSSRVLNTRSYGGAEVQSLLRLTEVNGNLIGSFWKAFDIILTNISAWAGKKVCRKTYL